MAEIKSAMLIGSKEIDNFINYKISEFYGVTTIATYKNADEALAHLVETDIKYQLILIDLNMPLVDGLEFIDQFYLLKQNKKHGKICVLSASLNPSDKEKYEERKAEFIEKPLSIEKLLYLESL